MNKKITIALIFRDKEYLYALSGAILRNSKEFLMNIYEHDDLSGSSENIFSDNEIVLTDFSFKDFKNIASDMRAKIIFFTEKLSSSIAERAYEKDKMCGIYKYSDLNTIIPCIYSRYKAIYGACSVVNCEAGNAAKLLLFKSLSGNSGNTSIALAVADELLRFHNKKVLMITFDEFSILDRFASIRPAAGEGVRKLDYLINKYGIDGIDIGAFLSTDRFGVSFLADYSQVNPMCKMDDEQVRRIYEAVMNNGRFSYDIIITDYCGLWSDQVFSYLTALSELLILTSRNDESISKYNKRRDYLINEMGVSESKMINIENFSDLSSEFPRDERHLMLPVDYNLHCGDNGGERIMVLDREFGQGIQQIVKVILQKLESGGGNLSEAVLNGVEI